MRYIALFLLSCQLQSAASIVAGWDLATNGAASIGGASYDWSAQGTPAFTTKGGFSCLGPITVSGYYLGSAAFNTYLGNNASSYQYEFHIWQDATTGLQQFWGADAASGACGAEIGFYTSTGNFDFQSPPGVSCLAGSFATPATGAWHSIIVSSNGTSVWMYLDNALASTTTTGPFVGPVSGSFLGHGHTFDLANGYIRTMRVFAGTDCAGTGTCADYVAPASTPTPQPLSPYMTKWERTPFKMPLLFPGY